MQLSQRLSKIAAMVTEGSRIADVGCDHGYLSISLIESGKVSRAIAMDVAKGPLSTARENVDRAGLTGRIDLRLSDGLRKLADGEADCVIIAGMGGILMRRILEEGKHALPSVKELILEPQSEYEEVRRFLAENGYYIDREDMVTEERKFYPIIHAVPLGRKPVNAEDYTLSLEFGDAMKEELLFSYGPCILEMRHPVLLQYLDRRSEILTGIEEHLSKKDTEAARDRLKEIDVEKIRIRQARRYFE